LLGLWQLPSVFMGITDIYSPQYDMTLLAGFPSCLGRACVLEISLHILNHT